MRSLWTEVDDSGDARAALRRAVGNRLDLMWRDLYFLDVDVPGRVDRSVTDRWRAELADTVGDAPYDSATGNRPVEKVLSMGEGDSTAEPLSLEAGGATFIELDLDLDRRSIVRLSPSMSAGNVTVDPQALTAYDLDPASGPDTCALPANDGGDQVIDFDPAVCDGLSIVVSNTSLDDPASGTLGIEVGDRVDTTITNGLIRLGVHAEGHLDVPGFDASSGTGTTTVGLRWQPTNADALAPGCACEGWGVADLDHGVGGWANASSGRDPGPGPALRRLRRLVGHLRRGRGRRVAVPGDARVRGRAGERQPVRGARHDQEQHDGSRLPPRAVRPLRLR